MTDADVEAVARALCIADGLDPDADWRVKGVGMAAVALPPGETQRWRTKLRAARAAIAAYRARLEAEGKVIVPSEPTLEMLLAGQGEIEVGREPTGHAVDIVVMPSRDEIEACWRAMLKASGIP